MKASQPWAEPSEKESTRQLKSHTHGASLNLYNGEKQMPEPRFEGHSRDAERSIQAAQSASAEVYWQTVELFKRGVERTLDAHRQFLDVASQQSSDAANLWKSMFGNVPGAEPIFDFAEQTFGQFIELQRKTLDMMGQQGTEVADTARQQGERTMRAARETTEQASQQAREQRERMKSA
jgi:hypothetical protein